MAALKRLHGLCLFAFLPEERREDFLHRPAGLADYLPVPVDQHVSGDPRDTILAGHLSVAVEQDGVGDLVALHKPGNALGRFLDVHVVQLQALAPVIGVNVIIGRHLPAAVWSPGRAENEQHRVFPAKIAEPHLFAVEVLEGKIRGLINGGI